MTIRHTQPVMRLQMIAVCGLRAITQQVRLFYLPVCVEIDI